jgi:hypothetical protein
MILKKASVERLWLSLYRRGDESGIADGFSGAVDGEEKV